MYCIVLHQTSPTEATGALSTVPSRCLEHHVKDVCTPSTSPTCLPSQNQNSGRMLQVFRYDMVRVNPICSTTPHISNNTCKNAQHTTQMSNKIIRTPSMNIQTPSDTPSKRPALIHTFDNRQNPNVQQHHSNAHPIQTSNNTILMSSTPQKCSITPTASNGRKTKVTSPSFRGARPSSPRA